MKHILVNLLKDDRGHDLIEYGFDGGFVAVAAGAIMPGVSSNISQIFSKVQPFRREPGRQAYRDASWDQPPSA